jgi:anti-anti-sigma factor
MKYTIDKRGDTVLFKLEEENLNSVMAPDLKSQFIILHNEGIKNLIFQMNDIKYIDSSGLSSILTANRLWKDNGHFVLADIEHDFVNRLIQISRLDSILSIAGSVAEAEEFIAANPVNYSEEE